MKLFNKHKGKNAESDNETDQTKAQKGKLHTKRKSKSLLSKMKLDPSVAATVSDAINGDQAVVNSDRDFVKAQPLDFSDGRYYPVLILDEASLEDAGLGQKEHRDDLGQISVGLKSSSGASGFLPVITAESLQEDYIGLLPMHDALEALRNYPVFNDYKPGWLVGLVNIDDDILSLKLTDLRLSMAQWWSYVNSEVSFKVDDDVLKLDQPVPKSSDILAINDDEAQGGGAASNASATHVFDDDQADGSNTSISSFVNDEQVSDNTASPDVGPDSADQGFSLTDLEDDDDNEENVDEDVVESSGSAADAFAETPEEQNTDNQSADETDVSEAEVESDSEPTQPAVTNQEQPTRSTRSEPTQQKEPVKVTQKPNSAASQDELEADNVQMSASVQTLDDLKISISDQEFVNSYINNLTVEKLPMLDTTNDPTGRIAHENELRSKYNGKLQSALDSYRNRLRQFFETQRTAVLEAIRSNSSDEGSKIKANRKSINELQSQLNDNAALRDLAQSQVQDRLDEMDAQFEQQKDSAKAEVLAQIEREFNERRQTLEQRKEDLVASAVEDQRHKVTAQMTSLKKTVQDTAQSAAATAYGSIMDQGAQEFNGLQHSLQKMYDTYSDELSDYVTKQRQAENARVSDQADVARNDTTISQLQDQIKQMQQRHQDALQQNHDNYEAQLESVQAQATTSQQDAVARVQDELDKVTAERDNLNDKVEAQQADYQGKLDENAKLYTDQFKQIHNELQESEKKHDRATKRGRVGTFFYVAIAAVLFAGGGFLGGQVFHDDHAQPKQEQSQPKTIVVPYQQPQQDSSDKDKQASEDSESAKEESEKKQSEAESSSKASESESRASESSEQAKKNDQNSQNQNNNQSQNRNNQNNQNNQKQANTQADNTAYQAPYNGAYGRDDIPNNGY